MFIRNWKREIFTVPNLLSLLRLLLLPVYARMYLNAKTPREYLLAGAVMGLSCLTDLTDGWVARKYDQITNLGKVLDPLADKLTQLSLFICLSAHRRLLRYLLVIFLIKEFWQLFVMIAALRRGKALNGALMSGKISTTVLFTSLGLMFIHPGMSKALADALTVISFCFLMYAFADYAHAYFGKEKKIYDLE